MSVYTQHNLTKVFAELKAEVGKYDPETWVGTMPQIPNNIDDADKEVLYQNILDITNKHFKDRKPKGWQSLAMQVAVCLSTQKSENMEQSSVETRGRNRLAAYIAGFLTMKDIAILECSEKGGE